MTAKVFRAGSMFLVLLLIAGVVLGGICNMKASAWTCRDGEKEYSIAGDRYIYQTETAIDRSINTFEAWICLPSELADAVNCGVIFGNYYNKPIGFAGSVNFGVAAGGHLSLYWDNGRYVHTFEEVDLRNDAWTHVALVRSDDGTVEYFVNGESVATASGCTGESISPMNFGVGSDWNNWFDDKTPFMGKIKQVTVYDRAVTAARIAEDMTKTDITGEGLLGNWYFTEKWGSADIVRDSSAQGNDCTLATYDRYVDVIPVDDYDYSFVVVPDTQAMTCNSAYTNKFVQQQKWIADNVEALNIKFVSYLGDFTEHYYEKNPVASRREWALVKNNVSRLDGIVPYTVILGNHDYDNGSEKNRNATQYNQCFPYEKFSQTPTFGGAFKKGDMSNYYSLVQVGDIEYMIFSLEYGPRHNVINWADRMISEHPDSRVIITTHCMMTVDGSFTNASSKSAATSYIKYDTACDGVTIWEKLAKKHANVMMTFSGHICTDQVVMRRDAGDNGNTVTSILADAQGAMMTSGMNTLLLVKVNERTKTMSMCYYSPEMDACYNMQNQFTISFADEHNPTVGEAQESAQPPVSPAGQVTVTVDDGTNVRQFKADRGEKAEIPQTPQREGYSFGGWYVGDRLYNFDKPLTDDITLTARWLVPCTGELSLLKGNGVADGNSFEVGQSGSVYGTIRESFAQGELSCKVVADTKSDNGLVFCMTPSGNSVAEGEGVSFYFFFLGIDGTVYLGKAYNGNWCPLGVLTDVGITSGQTYTLKVVIDGTNIYCYVDDRLYLIYSEQSMLTGTGYGVRGGAQGVVFSEISVSDKAFQY